MLHSKENRNCRYFPEEWAENTQWKWRPRYVARAGDKKGRPDAVLSITTNECPSSLVTVESIHILGDFVRAKSAHRAFGAVPYGLNSARWPAYYADAVAVLTSAENEADRIESGS